MAAHNELGKKGETLAAAWFAEQGYEILHQNWRHARAEVDIIASRKSVLHFIEVKSRRDNAFGHPEESVNQKKIQNLMLAAEEFLDLFPQWKKVQYDILAIIVNQEEKADFFLIEDIYL
ncbi:MAG TPA: YraN family protein [Puia sp.]|nr:YraN family protein [Puia sp.]